MSKSRKIPYLVGGWILVASLLMAPIAEASAIDTVNLGWMPCTGGLTYTYRVGNGSYWTSYEWRSMAPPSTPWAASKSGVCNGTYCTITMSIGFYDTEWNQIRVGSNGSSTAVILSTSCQ